MVNYFDGILGCIGTLLAAGAVTAVFTHSAVIIVFALAACLFLGHALFIAPPVSNRSQNQTTSAQRFAD